MKRKATSAAAILSLALAIGACTSAFRLIDALLLRPLPVAQPERLYALTRQGVDFDGEVRTDDSWAYPAFRLMRAAVKGQAELLAISPATRRDLTYKADQEMEKAYLQYVSGWMFGAFGLRPAAGRLFTENDDLQPRAHPYAVMLAFFFAVVALLLAGVGLYGVLDYSVLQRRREIGIRMALGAQAGDVARRVTVDVFSMVLLGALAGLGLGIAFVRYIESLLYQVKATDMAMLARPSLTILTVALLAALPAVIRAVRIDPAMMLREE